MNTIILLYMYSVHVDVTSQIPSYCRMSPSYCTCFVKSPHSQERIKMSACPRLYFPMFYLFCGQCVAAAIQRPLCLSKPLTFFVVNNTLFTAFLLIKFFTKNVVFLHLKRLFCATWLIGIICVRVTCFF